MVTVLPRRNLGFQLSDAELLLIGQGRGCVQTRGAWRDVTNSKDGGAGQKRGG